jgi:hypothetical protein
VPRGSFQPLPAEVFSSLGRLIADRLDRGVVLLDEKRGVQDANTLARRLLADGNGVTVRAGRFVFIDPELDGRFSRLIEGYRKGTPGAARAMWRSSSSSTGRWPGAASRSTSWSSSMD